MFDIDGEIGHEQSVSSATMRKLLMLFALAPIACTVIKPAARTPETYGLTIEEDAQILGLEDRREFDPAIVTQWTQNPNPLHRARLALALGRIGPHTFVDTNGNGERDADERQAGVAELITLADDSESNVRTTVAFALGEIGDATAIETLFKLANDGNATVAAEAAEALSKLAKDVPIARYVALTTSGVE